MLAYSARDVRIRSPGLEARGERVEDHVPRAGRVLDERDLVGLRADERGDRVVDGGRTFCDRITGGVAPDACFELEVLDDGVDDDARGECCARVVEVDDVETARRVSAGALDVDRCVQLAATRCSRRHSDQSSVK